MCHQSCQLGPQSPPATIVAADYSCHFPFVSIFLDVIHVLCLNDMQANIASKVVHITHIFYLIDHKHMSLPVRSAERMISPSRHM